MSLSINSASNNSREQLLREVWLRHDAMWFQYVADNLGMALLTKEIVLLQKSQVSSKC